MGGLAPRWSVRGCERFSARSARVREIFQSMTLADRRCETCHAGIAPLSEAQARSLLGELDGWALGETGNSIHRWFSFKNFHQTMAFVNAVAWIAHQEDHHPDLLVRYSRCEITYFTHAISGLSENDFICAAKIDRLFSAEAPGVKSGGVW